MAAVSYQNAVSIAAQIGATQHTVAFNVGSGTNRAIFVGVLQTAGGTKPSSVTYNGTACTEIRTDSSAFRITTYYLVNPTSGSNTLAVNFAGSTTCSVVAIAMNDVSPTSPINDHDAGSANNQTITTDSVSTLNDCMACDMWGAGGGLTYTVGADQTQRIQTNNAAHGQFGGSTEPKATAGTITMSWAITPVSSNWQQSVAVFAPLSNYDLSTPVDTVTVTESVSVTQIHAPSPTNNGFMKRGVKIIG